MQRTKVAHQACLPPYQGSLWCTAQNLLAQSSGTGLSVHKSIGATDSLAKGGCIRFEQGSKNADDKSSCRLESRCHQKGKSEGAKGPGKSSDYGEVQEPVKNRVRHLSQVVATRMPLKMPISGWMHLVLPEGRTHSSNARRPASLLAALIF